MALKALATLTRLSSFGGSMRRMEERRGRGEAGKYGQREEQQVGSASDSIPRSRFKWTGWLKWQMVWYGSETSFHG